MNLPEWSWKLSGPEKRELQSLLTRDLTATIAKTNARALVSRPPCPEVAPVGAEVAGREVGAVSAKGISR